MGAILDKTVERAVAKNWIPIGDKQAVINRMQQLGTKYNFSPDDLAIAMHMESCGMYPKSDNGTYFGIMQIGDVVMKEINTSRQDILSKSALQQLEIVDRYFALRKQYRTLPAKPDLAALYLSILWPAAAKETDFNKPLTDVPKQAPVLYPNGNGGGGSLTKNSIIAGLKKHAAANLGVPLGESQVATGNGTAPIDAAQSNAQAIGEVIRGTISAIFNGVCDDVFPVEFNIAEAIVYPGCYSKIASATQSGSGLPYSAPGVGVIGASGQATALNNNSPGPTLAPGSFAKPSTCKAGAGEGSQFGSFRSKTRRHQGRDYECNVGTPIYATADGTVSRITTHHRAGNYIEITHSGGAVSRYLHLSKFQVTTGQQVKQGDQIALSGNTGIGTGPHLHFEIVQNGVPQNPDKLLKG